ncbi:uncharacterized protein LOC106662371 [Cimex lectularius]|uniref:Uncharacterized protein n=1 Tax=Cimex lectularius TaxID=79782 RepID=A0A8I6TDQ8_CIMLE|nr:uncharacterized protein LOC106662371 [Cimex lectularius]
MEESSSEKEPLVEEGEVPSSEGQVEEEDFDIYKGFDIDEPFDTNCTDNDEEWRIFNLSVENGEETKSLDNKSAGKESKDSASESASELKMSRGEAEAKREETSKMKSLLDSNHIPSLMSLKTEPPEYYTSRRQERKYYGHKWRNSRSREYDRGSPYRNRKESYEGRQQFYDRRNKPRISDSRFK